MRGLALAAIGLVAAGIFGSPAPAAGQGAGSAASTVLRIAPAPRPLALGNAMTAVPDAFALEYNPAAVWGGAAEVVAAYQTLPVGATAGSAALRLPGDRLTFGLSLRFLDYGQVEVVEPDPTSPVGTPTGGTASGGELTALAGLAYRLGPVRIGVAGRWLQLEVAGLRDAVAAADAGLLWSPLEWLALGASVQNLGQDVEAGRASPLPRTLRAGARVDRQVGPVQTMVAVEARRREARTGVGVGLETGLGGPELGAVLRLGYESRPSEGDAYAPLVFGGGIRLDRLSVDLAYRALGPLGSTTQVGLGYRF